MVCQNRPCFHHPTHCPTHPRCLPQARQQQLLQEKRKQEEKQLLAALGAPMGFHKGKPLAALIIFRACLQWRSFSADRTGVFDAIFQVGGCSVEAQAMQRLAAVVGEAGASHATDNGGGL